MKLHVGAGDSPLPGWTNIDVAPYPGVDITLDVRAGMPFEHVDLIFAEHFIEHLTLQEGIGFLHDCRRTLAPAGVLRLSTPNLDWVWLTHYRKPDTMTEQEQLLGCLEINRAFHGWGHRFLYNLRTLTSSLRAAGFESVLAQSYGESSVAELRGLERHERHMDQPGAPSVIVVEASGIASSLDTRFETLVAPYIRDAQVT